MSANILWDGIGRWACAYLNVLSELDHTDDTGCTESFTIQDVHNN